MKTNAAEEDGALDALDTEDEADEDDEDGDLHTFDDDEAVGAIDAFGLRVE